MGLQIKAGSNEDQMVCPDQNYCTYQVLAQALHSGRLVPVSLYEMSPIHFVKAHI